MNPPSSSISSSDRRPAGWRRGLALFAWVCVWLIALDVAAGTLFAYPVDPRDTAPGPMALYFDYGRSMEGRLRRMTRAEREETAPITLAGWYEPLVAQARPGEPDAPRVSIYGMSHAMRLAEALRHADPTMTVRSIGAPGATTNWAYGAFRRDQDRRQSDVAVLAIMSSTLPMIVSPAPMNWNTSFALPYTADRYVRNGSELRVIRPPYESFEGYVATLNEGDAWDRALVQFARTDPFYDSWLFRDTVLDRSVLVRMTRRASAQRRDRRAREGVFEDNGSGRPSEGLLTARAIISAFARQARREGIVPVIYVVDSFGYRDQLTQALAETLRSERIPFVSSSSIVDPADPRNYLADSHFTDANDLRLAQALQAIVKREIRPAQAS